MISGEKIGNGRDAAKAYIDNHADISKDLEGKLRMILKGTPAAQANQDGEITTPAAVSADAEDK